MGLAATQARFLAVTSRKANCEFRSMELAQQKLSLSRELQEATEQYQDSLNATQLIWDADGTGDYRYQLSYDLMMKPSDLNKYTPYLLTRQDGKVALDDKIVKAATGIFNTVTDPLTGVTSSDGGILRADGTVAYRGDADFDDVVADAYIRFIDGLQENRAISGAIVDKIATTDTSGFKTYTYVEDAGLGGELAGKETSNMMTINSVMSYIDYIVENVASGYFPVGSDEAKLADKLVFDFDNDKSKVGGADYSCHLNTAYNSQDGSTCLMLNGDYCNKVTFDSTDTNKAKMQGVAQYSTQAITLSDLLSEDVSLLVTGKAELNKVLEIMTKALRSTESMGASALLTDDVNVWYDKFMTNTGAKSYEQLVREANSNNKTSAKTELALLNYFDKLAKSMYALFMPESPEAKDSNAFYTALADVITRLRNNISSGTETSYENIGSTFAAATLQNSEAFAKSAVNHADDYNCWVQCGNEWAISLSNLTEACLTNFINGIDDYQDGCLIVKKATSSTYITDDPEFLFTVNTLDETETGLWESEFYSIIFNSLCSSGWYENEQVADKIYLDNALKNGQLFVSSLANDNYYYQTRYTQASGGHIMQETDDAAIAAAEREYIYTKNKINYKEEQIEVESKNVDAELQALSTEYETVKTLIKNNIDKTFKLFSS